MRKFLMDYDGVITIWDVYYEWELWEKENMTFQQYLADCLGKNGALTEILTDETPNDERERAVTLCRVHYSDERDDYCDEWLREDEIDFKRWCGYYVER